MSVYLLPARECETVRHTNSMPRPQLAEQPEMVLPLLTIFEEAARTPGKCILHYIS
jgi:hypothetical protein